MKTYSRVLLCAMGCFLPVFLAVTFLAGLAGDCFDGMYKARFRSQTSTYYHKYNNGIPIDHYTVLYGLRRFKKTKNILVVGSSTTREGILDDELSLPAGYRFTNFSIPGQGISELALMLDFVQKNTRQPPDKTDWVKLDIGVGFFKTRTAEESIFKTMVQTGGVYRVDAASLTVSKGPGSRLLLAQFLKGQSVLEEIKILLKNEKISAEPYRETMFKRYKELWTRNLGDFDLSDSESERFFALLIPLAEQTNVVVETIYAGSWVLDTKQGQTYLAWIESTLKPRLAELGISLIDTTRRIEDRFYAEQSHLNYEGRVLYTKIESEILTELVNKGGDQRTRDTIQ